MDRKNKRVFGEIVLLLAAILIAMAGARLALTAFYRAAYPTRYASLVERYSEQNDLAPSLVYAVIRTESGFNPQAASHLGARGLMQITEDTFQWVAFREGEPETVTYGDMLEEEANIRFGTALLRLHLKEFGTAENALCAYHAGRGNLRKWLLNPEYSPDGERVEHIPFGDTRRYVSKVTETMEIYQQLYHMP